MSKTRQPRFGTHITRRDFVNGMAAGAGAALTVGAIPTYGQTASNPILPLLGADWYGYGGVGSFRYSHRNTPEVVETAHRVLDRQYPIDFAQLDTVEEIDLVILGAGMAGLGAALEFSQQRRDGQTCIM